MKYISKQNATIALLTLTLVGALIFMPSSISQMLFGSITGGDEAYDASTITKEELYIPNNYTASAGETGTIALKASTHFGDAKTIAGFSTSISFNPDYVTIKGLSVAGTPLEGQGFFVEKSISNGVLNIIAATGGKGASINQGDTIVNISLDIADNIPLGTALAFDINNTVLIDSNLQEISVSGRAGNINIETSGALEIDNFEIISQREVQITFSDEIVTVSTEDFVFDTNGDTSDDVNITAATIKTNGKIVTISNISLLENTSYVLNIGPNLTANIMGTMKNGEETLSFTTPSFTDAVVGDFYPISAKAIDNEGSGDQIQITFNKAINPQTIEAEHFEVFAFNNLYNLPNIESMTLSNGNKTVTLTLEEADDGSHDISELIERPIIKITKVSPSNDAKNAYFFESTDGENPSLQIISAILPDEQDPDYAPARISGFTADEENKTLTVNFNKSIVTSTFKLAESLLVTKEGYETYEAVSQEAKTTTEAYLTAQTKVAIDIQRKTFSTQNTSITTAKGKLDDINDDINNLYELETEKETADTAVVTATTEKETADAAVATANPTDANYADLQAAAETADTNLTNATTAASTADTNLTNAKNTFIATYSLKDEDNNPLTAADIPNATTAQNLVIDQAQTQLDIITQAAIDGTAAVVIAAQALQDDSYVSSAQAINNNDITLKNNSTAVSTIAEMITVAEQAQGYMTTSNDILDDINTIIDTQINTITTQNDDYTALSDFCTTDADGLCELNKIDLSSAQSSLSTAFTTLIGENKIDKGTAKLSFNDARTQVTISDVSFSDTKNENYVFALYKKQAETEVINNTNRINIDEIKSIETNIMVASSLGTGATTGSGTLSAYSYIETFLGNKYIENDFAVTNVEATGKNTVKVTFNKELNDSALLALNFPIKTGSTALKVASVSKNSNIVTLTTALQTAGNKYTLSLDSAKIIDTAGNKLLRNNTFLFTGYTPEVPEITHVSPALFENTADQILTIYGDNIDSTGTLNIGNTTYEIISSTDGQITIKIPKGFEAGDYNITYTNDEGEKSTLQNAFIVEEEEEEMVVLSDESYASPYQVPNDGTTTTTLWVRVEDPRGLSDIEKVTADLRPIGGRAAVEFTPDEIIDMKQWFALEITVPNTVSTSSDPYSITVTAENKSGIRTKGVVTLEVTNLIGGGIAPEIMSASAEPSDIVKDDTENPTHFYAQISDDDGASDIAEVALDLSKIGHGTIFLQAVGGNTSTKGKTQFFESTEGYVIPGRIADGTYSLPLTIIDNSGEETTGSITVQVGVNSNSRPEIDDENIYVTPDDELIADGKSTFQVHVKVEDPSGAEDIEAVTLNLVALGLPPIDLNPGSLEGRSIWYSSDVLTLPITTVTGYAKLEITATDYAGNSDNEEIYVEVVKTSKKGSAPTVVSAKGYSTPAQVTADGSTTFSAYVYVEDPDQDISHVIMQLGNQAVYTAANLPEGTSAVDAYGNELCISTRTLLCMRPILSEGEGQWFHLPDLVVPPGVEDSSDAYRLPVVAVDTTGKSSKGYFNLYVGSDSADALIEQPYPKSAIATAKDIVQIVFSSAMDASSVKKGHFQIVETQNNGIHVGIKDIDVSVDGRVVTLYTNTQESGKQYAIKVDSESLNLRTKKVTDGIVYFTGYTSTTREKNFKMTNANPLSSTSIELTFNAPISYDAIINLQNFEVVESGKTNHLTVKRAEISREQAITLYTSEQTAGVAYTAYASNVSSPSAVEVSNTLNASFEGYSFLAVNSITSLQNQADFNQDNSVDFLDFTLFSSVYNTKIDGESVVGDFNGDGKVDFLDFTLFSAKYGTLSDPTTQSETPENNLQTFDTTSSSSFNQNSSVGTTYPAATLRPSS